MNNADELAAAGELQGDKFTVVVNAREKVVSVRVLSFHQVVGLAFDPIPSGENVLFTVTFRNADGNPSEGSLTEGSQVHIKKSGTVFNVSATDKS